MEYEDLIFGMYSGRVLLHYISSVPCLIFTTCNLTDVQTRQRKYIQIFKKDSCKKHVGLLYLLFL